MVGLGVGVEQPALCAGGVGHRPVCGGQFTTAGGDSANYVAKWNGSAWSALGLG